MENRSDKLRALLKKYEMQRTADNFTEEVMKEIIANVDDKVYTTSRLKAALSRNLTDEPSTGFTYTVLNKIKNQRNANYPPIISRKAWALIIAFLVICLILSVDVNGNSGQVTELFLIPLGNYISTFTSNLLEPLFYVGIITLSAGLLLLIDYWFKKILRSETID